MTTTPSSIYDAKVVLPGLQLTPSKGFPVPEEVKALTSDGSVLVFLKKFEGNLSLFGNEKLILEAVYESRGTAPAHDGAEAEEDVVEEPENEEDSESWPNDDPWAPDLDDEFVDLEYEKLVDKMEWGKTLICCLKKADNVSSLLLV